MSAAAIPRVWELVWELSPTDEGIRAEWTGPGPIVVEVEMSQEKTAWKVELHGVRMNCGAYPVANIKAFRRATVEALEAALFVLGAAWERSPPMPSAEAKAQALAHSTDPDEWDLEDAQAPAVVPDQGDGSAVVPELAPTEPPPRLEPAAAARRCRATHPLRPGVQCNFEGQGPHQHRSGPTCEPLRGGACRAHGEPLFELTEGVYGTTCFREHEAITWDAKRGRPRRPADEPPKAPPPLIESHELPFGAPSHSAFDLTRGGTP